MSDQIAGWAANAGITETDAFARCLTSDIARVAVEDNNAVGTALGIRGTPTLFVNGRRIVGAVPLAFIEGAIAEALTAQRR
jgi:protein-disulfide isomerase